VWLPRGPKFFHSWSSASTNPPSRGNLSWTSVTLSWHSWPPVSEHWSSLTSYDVQLYCWSSQLSHRRTSATDQFSGSTMTHQLMDKKLSYRRDSARCVKQPFEVTQRHPFLCQSTRHMLYDCLLALSSNLTSIFNRSWYITSSLHIHTPPLFQVELEKTAGSRWIFFGVRVPRTLDCLTMNVNRANVHSMITKHTRLRQTDGQTSWQ